MKKTFLKISICLIVGLILENAFYNIFCYNYFIKEFTSNHAAISFLLLVLFFLIPLTPIYFARIITKKSISPDSDKETFNCKYKTNKLIIGLINTFSHIGLLVYYIFRELTNATHFNSYDSSFCESFGYDIYDKTFYTIDFDLLLDYTVWFIWFLLIGISSYRIIRYSKPTKKSLIRFIATPVFSVALCLMVCFAIYNYLPINEFKYIYSFYEDYDEVKKQNVKKVCIGDSYKNKLYQNILDDNKKEIVIPKSLFGIEVGEIDIRGFEICNKNTNIILPGDLNYNVLKNVYFEILPEEHEVNIMLDSNNSDCFIDNNILYSNDGKRLHMLSYSPGVKNKITFTKDLKQIDNYAAALWYNTDVKEFDNRNPYYIMSDDTIWSKGSMLFFHNNPLSPGKDGSRVIGCLPLVDSPIVALNNDILESGDMPLIMSSDYRIYIPKDFNKMIDFTWISQSGCKGFVVDNQNKVYYSVDGKLYLKSGDKLIAGIRYDYKISRNVKDIDVNTLYDVRSCLDYLKFDKEFASGDSFIEDNNLYTYNKEKIIFAKDIMKVSSTTKEISNDFIDYSILYFDSQKYTNYFCSKIEVDQNNQYFSVIDDILFDKNGEKLIFIPSGKKTISIPSSLKEIDERYYKILDNYDIIVDENNDIFEEYEGNLYTKGLEKLLAIGKVDIIKLPKELKEITNDAIYQMCYRKVELDNQNPYFESTENELWKNGKYELVSIIGNNDRIVRIPDNTNKIGDVLLEAINIKNTNANRIFEVAENNDLYFSYDGCLYNKNNMELIATKCDEVLLDFDNYMVTDEQKKYIKVHPDCTNISFDSLYGYDSEVFDFSKADKYQELLEKHAKGYK